MADNCVLHKMSGKLNLPYQAFALLCLVFPFPNHLQVSSPATSGVFLANSSCGASRSCLSPLPFSSGSPEDSVLQQAPSPSKPCSIHSCSVSHARICSPSLHTLNTNQPFLSLADTVWQHYFWCMCKQAFTASIVLVFLSMLTSRSNMHSTILTL